MKLKAPPKHEIQLTPDDVKILLKCVEMCKSVFPFEEFKIKNASRLFKMVSQTLDSYQAYLTRKEDVDDQVWQLLNLNDNERLVEQGKEKDWESECDRIVKLLPLDLVLSEMQPEMFLVHKDERSLPHQEPQSEEEEETGHDRDYEDEMAVSPEPKKPVRRKKGPEAFTSITPKKRSASGKKKTSSKSVKLDKGPLSRSEPDPMSQVPMHEPEQLRLPVEEGEIPLEDS